MEKRVTVIFYVNSNSHGLEKIIVGKMNLALMLLFLGMEM